MLDHDAFRKWKKTESKMSRDVGKIIVSRKNGGNLPLGSRLGGGIDSYKLVVMTG